MFLCVWNIKIQDQKKFSFLVLILSVISFTVILISGERTSIGLFVLSLLFIFFSSNRFRRSLIVPLIAIIIIFSFTLSYSDKLKNRILTQTIKQMGLTSSSERVVLFSKLYEGHYKISYNMFKEKPIFGHGAKMFRVYCLKEENFVADDACTTHPHNFYAQMIAETGIIGLITMLSIFLF